MADSQVFRGAFSGPDEKDRGRRPVIFDILMPDRETSMLPEGYRLVLHVNPASMAIKSTKRIERIQTRGGYVEQHWGDDTQSLSFNGSTGGFMRLYTGKSGVTDPTVARGSRRETLAYEKYLDFLALFHNNGSVYDATGRIIAQGIIKVTFDGGVYLGWFNSFTVTESSGSPYQFTLSAEMEVAEEVQVWRTAQEGAGGALATTNPVTGESSGPSVDFL